MRELGEFSFRITSLTFSAGILQVNCEGRAPEWSRSLCPAHPVRAGVIRPMRPVTSTMETSSPLRAPGVSRVAAFTCGESRPMSFAPMGERFTLRARWNSQAAHGTVKSSRNSGKSRSLTKYQLNLPDWRFGIYRA